MTAAEGAAHATMACAAKVNPLTPYRIPSHTKASAVMGCVRTTLQPIQSNSRPILLSGPASNEVTAQLRGVLSASGLLWAWAYLTYTAWSPSRKPM